MTPTLRRLNDRERYWGLTWPGWLAVAVAAGGLYGAVKLSPFGTKATVTVVVLALAFAAVVLAGVSGQALSPGRQLLAIAGYRRSPKRYRLSDRPALGGLVLDRLPAAAPVDRIADESGAREINLAGRRRDDD